MTDLYAPPKTEALPPSEDHLALQLPGVSRRITIKPPAFFTGARILIDGVMAERAGLGLFGKVKIPRDDGTVLEARIQYALSGLVVVVGKEKYPVGAQNPAWLGILVFLPIGLIAVGGALGGILGASGMMANRKIAGSHRSNGAKAAIMLAIFALEVVLLLLLVGMVQLSVQPG